MADIRGGFGSLPEAERYFRDKTNMPSRRWDELWQGQHARAFTVAGATRDELLSDLRAAVDAAISQGETLEDFRARFREIVQRRGWHGWTGEGTPAGEAWRTSIIYHTNLRTSYMAGRWETLKRFPYLKYKHNTVRNPREAHKAWDGLVLASDDPWWQTHYPPNGWGCRCSVIGVSHARLRADGKSPDQAPPPLTGDPPPEWSYHVGQASSGQQLADQGARSARRLATPEWDPISDGSPFQLGRPGSVPVDPRPALPPAAPASLEAALEVALGAPRLVPRLPNGHQVAAVANAQTLAAQSDVAAAALAPLLPEVLASPFEVWAGFERHRHSGEVLLRTTWIRAIAGTDGVLVVEAWLGQLQRITLVDPADLDRRRRGRLIYGRG